MGQLILIPSDQDLRTASLMAREWEDIVEALRGYATPENLRDGDKARRMHAIANALEMLTKA
jgi:hypothetical protein